MTDTTAAPVVVTMGDLVAFERFLGRALAADGGSGFYAVESAAWLTWRHRGAGASFDEWLENGADVPYSDVVAQAAQLLGMDPEGKLPGAPPVDPSPGGSAPSKG